MNQTTQWGGFLAGIAGTLAVLSLSGLPDVRGFLRELLILLLDDSRLKRP